MTRKQALTRAIEVLKLQGENEAAQVLEVLHSELPLIHWSDASIRDTVEQYILDNGKPPTASSFKAAGMPPHPVIKNKYGMTLGAWLEANYPTPKPSWDELRDQYTAEFIAEYERIKPRSAEEYNAKRIGAKGWLTIKRYNEVETWRQLLKKLGLQPYFDLRSERQPVKFQVRFHVDTDFAD